MRAADQDGTTGKTSRWRGVGLAGGALIVVLAALAVVLGLRGHGHPAQAQTPVIEHPIGANVITPWGAVRAQDGALVWSRDLTLSQPPLNVNGILYTVQRTQQGNMLVAIRALSGSMVWSVKESCFTAQLAQTTTSIIVPCFTSQPNTGRSGTFTLQALDLLTGHPLWQSAPVAAAFPPTVDTPVSYISSITVLNGQIIVVYDTASQTPDIAAWNAQTGTQTWHHALTGAPVEANPISQNGDGVEILSYASEQNLQITAIDPASGAQRWSVSANRGSVDALTPALIVASSNNTVTAWHVQDGTIAWNVTLPATGQLKYVQFVAQQGDTIIYRADEACGAPNGEDCISLFALNIASGKQIWQHALPPNMPYNAIAFFFDGTTLIASTFYQQGASNTYTLFALRGSDGSQLWSHTVSGMYEFGIMSDGRLFVYGGGGTGQCSVTLSSFVAATGDVSWQHTFTPTVCAPAYQWFAWIELA